MGQISLNGVSHNFGSDEQVFGAKQQIPPAEQSD
jgi:hypothetical protein